VFESLTLSVAGCKQTDAGHSSAGGICCIRIAANSHISSSFGFACVGCDWNIPVSIDYCARLLATQQQEYLAIVVNLHIM
jgi:hypothetical protein